MKFNKWRKWAFILTIIGVTQFFVLCALAMIFYPGGTELNPSKSGYSFFTNAVSDLGRTQSLTGDKNLVSRVLYIIALVLVNIFFIPFYMAMSFFFSEKRAERLFCNLAAISGIISALFGIGTALFPVDLFPTIHLSAAVTFGIFSAIALSFYTIPILLNHSYPNQYGYVIISYAVLLAIYLLLVLINPFPMTERGLIIMATGQKIILFSGFLCFSFLAFGALKRYNRLSEENFSARII